jgi:hypothetical protein
MKRILLLLLLCLSGTIAMAQTTWTGLGANTNWNNTDNWDTNAIPGATDDVIIPTGFTVTLNVIGTVKSIDVQGNSTFDMNTSFTFSEPSAIAANAILNWANGTLNGGGSTLTNNGTFNLTTASSKILGGMTIFNNEGTLNMASAGDLIITDGVLNNQLNGVIDLQVDGGNISFSGSASRILNNYGLIKRTTSIGDAQIHCFLNNLDGTISVESGSLTFGFLEKTLTDGTYNVAASTVMNWDITVNISGTLTGVLDGNLDWSTTVIAVTTATFDFSGVNAINWSSGTLTGGGTVTNNGVLDLTTSAGHTISGLTTFNNLDTVNLTSGGDLLISDGIFNNQASGTIDMQADAGNLTYSGSASRILNNYGLIKKTTSAGNAQIQCFLNNLDGTISVESGSLTYSFLEKTLTDGTYNVAAGAVMNWDITVNISGTLTGVLDGDLDWSTTVSTATTATFDFTGTNGLIWSVGSLTGGGTLVNKSPIDLTTNSGKNIIGLTTLNNESDINITSAGNLLISDGVLNNQPTGIIDMQADVGYITYSGSASRILNNFGLIKRTTTTGDTQIQCALNNNNGTIEVESGTLTLSFLENTLTDGNINVATGSALIWSSLTTVAGTIQGNLDGNISWKSAVNVPIGTTATFEFNSIGGLNWELSVLQGGGTLVNKSPINLTTGASKSIIGLTTLNNESEINITSGGDLLITDGIVNNQPTGIIDLQVDGGNITYSGAASRILNNFGLLKKSGGAGLTNILVQTTNSGIIDVMEGELEFTDPLGLNNTATGVIKGVATIDIPLTANFTNDGTFAPGASPGTLNVLGDFKSSATSVLDVELDGLIQDTEYDLLAITGTNVVFDGSVNITMGFEAEIGNTFTIATTTGTIATQNLATPVIVDHDGKRYTFDITYPGDNQVLLTISDKLDIQVPDVLTQNITIQLDASGNASITEAQIDNGSSDNCTLTPNLIFSLDITDFTCADLGDNTVTLTVTDEATNSANATAIVTVEDSIDPIVITQNITVQLDASGNASIVPADVNDGSSDNCMMGTLSLDVTDFTCANLGANTVSLTVTDQSGNNASSTATVVVEDSIDPIVITQDITVQLDASGNASIVPADVNDGSSDNCMMGTLSLDVTDFTCANLGANTVNLTVTDQSGNNASSQATVTVGDTIFPSITCPGAGGFTIFNAGAYTLPDYVGETIIAVEDNCSFDVVQTPLPGTVLPDGDYTISLVVTDFSGNESTCLFELKVRDTTLSVDDQELLDSDIVLFPNPVVDNFTIQNNSRLNLIDLQIIDVTGKMINSVNLKQMSRTIEISIENYANGVYFVKINALNSFITKQIIKQ